MKDIINAYKKLILVVLTVLAFIAFSVGYLGFAIFCSENPTAANFFGINTVMSIVYFIFFVVAYVLILVGILKEKRFLVTVPLIGLAAFVGTMFVSKFSNAFIDAGSIKEYNTALAVVASVVDLLLLTSAILYIVGYLCKKEGCQKALDIILYIGIVVAVAEFVLACFAQSKYQAFGWQYAVLGVGYIFFYALMIVFLNRHFIEDKYIVGVLYSTKIRKED